MSERVFVMSPRECFVFVLNCQSVFYDVTTRILYFCAARQLSTDPESLEISCRQENSQSHIFVFVVTAFSVVACVLLHAHPSLRTAQDVVSENIPSWHGLGLSCMVIASAAILQLC